MSERTIEIRFPGTTADEGNRLAAELQNELWALGEGVEMRRKRENEQAQDFGATLVLILGTTAVTAIARGIEAWIRRTGTRIELSDGTVIKNVDSSNLAAVAAALRGGSAPQ